MPDQASAQQATVCNMSLLLDFLLFEGLSTIQISENMDKEKGSQEFNLLLPGSVYLVF
jgi:hypothetical protein